MCMQIPPIAKDIELWLGDSAELLGHLEDDSVDSIVTDPPYGLKFMGKEWDKALPPIEIWQECFRVIKPGGYIIAMSASRTYHRLAVQLEDIGFICHPMLGWIYGSGFPKATDLSKQFDKAAGAEREVVGIDKNTSRPNSREHNNTTGGNPHGDGGVVSITAPSTDLAKQWDGWKYGLQSLKPALEPIFMGQKPCELKPMVRNVEKWGVGAVNIDACRVDGNYDNQGGGSFATGKYKNSNVSDTGKDGLEYIKANPTQGRHPANLLHDGSDEVEAEFLEQGGIRKSGTCSDKYVSKECEQNCMSGKNYERPMQNRAKSEGSAARFFYCAKASKSERNAGLENVAKKEMPKDGHLDWGDHGQTGKPNKPPLPQQNHHPTVKPLALMKWLCRLITPPGGTLVDPFAGSGTTILAAKLEGFKAIGIEEKLEYYEIAEKRTGDARAQT